MEADCAGDTTSPQRTRRITSVAMREIMVGICRTVSRVRISSALVSKDEDNFEATPSFPFTPFTSEEFSDVVLGALPSFRAFNWRVAENDPVRPPCFTETKAAAGPGQSKTGQRHTKVTKMDTFFLGIIV